MMTVENPTRARFDTLIQIVAEQRQQGVQPDTLWLEEISRIATMRPEWIAPPAVVIPPVAPPVTLPVPTATTAAPPAAPPGVPPRAAIPYKPGERKPILIDDDVRRIVNEVLKTWGERFCIFQSGGKLFEVQVDKSRDMKFLVCAPTAPRLLQVGAARARSLAACECQFGQEKFTKDGTPTSAPCLPPEWLGSTITTWLSFDQIPILAALAQAPTLRRDGALIWERGYDASTGIYLASDLKVTVPENPSQDDAKAAMARLLDLVSDFDFVNPAGKSVWAAGLLSVAARHTFNGPVPIIIIDAAKRGSGKTTLVDVASIIASGGKASRMFYTDDDVEMDKRITSLALAGEQTVLIDNIVGKLASPPLDAALTSDSYRGRVLGKSEMTPAMPMKIVWFATGNGLVIGADTARRTILARLEPETDHPEDRTGPRPGQPWKYTDLIGYVTENRSELLSCALTVVKAYIQAGRQNMNLTPMGSFEAWSDTIRSAIVWAGAEDPCATIKDARGADLQDHALRAMVECWPVTNEVEVTAASLIEWAEINAPMGAEPNKRDAFERTRTIREMWRNALLEWLPAKKGDLPTARELGYALRAMKGSVIGDHKIEAGTPLRSGIPWKRVQVGASVTPITRDNTEIASLLSSVK
jgi:hypothetical protein